MLLSTFFSFFFFPFQRERRRHREAQVAALEAQGKRTEAAEVAKHKPRWFRAKQDLVTGECEIRTTSRKLRNFNYCRMGNLCCSVVKFVLFVIVRKWPFVWKLFSFSASLCYCVPVTYKEKQPDIYFCMLCRAVAWQADILQSVTHFMQPSQASSIATLTVTMQKKEKKRKLTMCIQQPGPLTSEQCALVTELSALYRLCFNFFLSLISFALYSVV